MTSSEVKGDQNLNSMIWSYLFLVNTSLYVNSLCQKGCLPKGVIRGCSQCIDCQKVSARWDPEGACTCVLEETPVFHPSEEEFKNTFKYIDSIRQQVEPYGLCRIVPPPSWQLPCFLEENDIWQSFKISTQIQRVNELQNYCSCKKASAAHETRETRRRKLGCEFGDGCAANFSSAEYHGTESCKSESGPQFTLVTFKRYADYFQECYFSRDTEVANSQVSPAMHPEQSRPSEQNIEGEYWRIVENPTEEIKVLYGTAQDSISFCSGFAYTPKQASDFVESFTSGWNLNYISRLPGSLLSFEMSDSSRILAPRLHVGMCFSSLPWNAEEHHLYKLHYLHLGAPRIWYGVSGCDLPKFEAVLKRHFPDSSDEHSKILHKLGRQLSPATLKSEDIQVHRCVQHPREFVLSLPGAYHSGFDGGFNCSTSAVFAPLDWLPHGQNLMELYCEQRRKTSISYDKMLLRAANAAVKAQWEFLLKGKKTPQIMALKEASGKDGILAKALRARIRSEARRRDYLSSASQSRKIDKLFDGNDQKRECATCHYDLYLSAAICPCNPNKFSCLKHTKHLCSCSWDVKIFLFRYLISELNILLEAVEGRLSAVRSWVKKDLGLALQWDKPNETQYGLADDPLSVAEASNDGAAFAEKDKACSSKLLSEAKAPLLDLKGKEFATSMGFCLSDSSDDTGSSSSSGSDIEAFIARLQSQRTGTSRQR